MTTIGEVLAALEQGMPTSKAAGWDPVGLQVGDPGASAARLAVCHEVTEAVVEALEQEPADLLITYHPLLFRPVDRLVAGATPAGRALRLARNGTAVAAVHTAFDVCPGGAADALAAALGLTQPQGFGPLQGAEVVKVVTFLPEEAADAVLEAVVAAGAATIGAYTHCSFRVAGRGSFFAGAGTDPAVGARGKLNLEPEVRIEFVAPAARESAVLAALVAAHPYEEPAYDVYPRRGEGGLVGRIGRSSAAATLGELASLVARALGASPRVAGAADRRVERVAAVPGSGADFIELAAAHRADVLVTGDLRHHAAREALDRGLALVDPGHAATERPGLAALLSRVAAIGPETVSLLEHDPDPWSP